MRAEQLAAAQAALAGRIAHLEAGQDEIKRDLKTLLADRDQARGAARVLGFLLLAVPSALASAITWFLTRP